MFEEKRQAITGQIKWAVPKNRRNVSDADISISPINDKNYACKRYSIVMRNNSLEIIGEGSKRINFGLFKNRLFIAPDASGKTFSKPGKDNPNYYCCWADRDGIFTEFTGDYSIKYDDFMDMYYIEKKEVKR